MTARAFLHSITLDNGAVQAVGFDTIQPGDLPAAGSIVGAFVEKAAAQSIPGAFAFTALSFPTVIRDDASFWSGAANTKLTAPTTGWYIVAGFVRWASNATGQRILEPRVNGAAISGTYFISQPSAADPDDPGQAFSFPHYFTAGDFIEWYAAQDSGGALNTQYASSRMVRLG